MPAHKKSLKFNTTAKIILGVLTILILDSVLVLFIIGFLPYLPSKEVRLVTFHVIAPILTCIFAITGIHWSFKNYRMAPEDRNQNAADTAPIVQYAKVIFASLFMGFVLPYIAMLNLAIPANIAASSSTRFQVIVDDVTGFRTVSPLEYAEIFFKYKNDKKRVFWKWDDPRVHGLKKGDCIELDGRTSSLGIYVDSISKLTSCSSGP